MNLPLTLSSTLPAEATSPVAAVRASTGASATVEGEAIVMRSPHGDELVRYHPATGLSLCAADGDLRLSAPHGRVVIEAAAGLEVDAAGPMSMRATSWRLDTEHATLVATRVEAKAQEWIQSVGRFELRARRLVESVGDAYRQVDDLLQTRAGRIRQIARGACQLFAERTSIASDGDTSIDGEHVYLG